MRAQSICTIKHVVCPNHFSSVCAPYGWALIVLGTSGGGVDGTQVDVCGAAFEDILSTLHAFDRILRPNTEVRLKSLHSAFNSAKLNFLPRPIVVLFYGMGYSVIELAGER
jgi:hypothetical protein